MNNSQAELFKAPRPFCRMRPKRMGFRRSDAELLDGLNYFTNLLTNPARPPVPAMALQAVQQDVSIPLPYHPPPHNTAPE